MTNFDDEPIIAVDDTQPRLEDTQPGPPVVTEFVRSDENPEEEEPRSGCGNRLMIVLVSIAFLGLIVSAIGLAGLAGWRDGVNEAQGRKSAAIAGTVVVQATLARQDCTDGRYELCNVRCSYVGTLQPSFPGIPACLQAAAVGLSITPTATATVTPTPQPATDVPAAITADASGAFSREELFVRSQGSMRVNDYETAVKWLEALRGIDADYHRPEVEDMLVEAYQALGTRYQNEGRLSEMIVVINKALRIRPLTGTSWEFTINAAQLYLDGKGYMAANNIARADAAFQKLIDIAPTYLDTKKSACEAFAAAGDTAYSKKYCQ